MKLPFKTGMVLVLKRMYYQVCSKKKVAKNDQATTNPLFLKKSVKAKKQLIINEVIDLLGLSLYMIFLDSSGWKL